jgi:hypothetical protein
LLTLAYDDETGGICGVGGGAIDALATVGRVQVVE